MDFAFSICPSKSASQGDTGNSCGGHHDDAGLCWTKTQRHLKAVPMPDGASLRDARGQKVNQEKTRCDLQWPPEIPEPEEAHIYAAQEHERHDASAHDGAWQQEHCCSCPQGYPQVAARCRNTVVSLVHIRRNEGIPAGTLQSACSWSRRRQNSSCCRSLSWSRDNDLCHLHL